MFVGATFLLIRLESHEVALLLATSAIFVAVFAFTEGTDNARAANVARRWRWGYGFLLLYAFGVCMNNLQDTEPGWWLLPLTVLTFWVRIRALQPASSVASRLRRALCEKFLEFLMILGTVVLSFALAVEWFETLPLNEVTLNRLEFWNDTIEREHGFLESLKPGIAATAACLVIFLTINLIFASRPGWQRALSVPGTLAVYTVRWIGRFSTAFVIAASICLVATGAGGVFNAVSQTLTRAQSDYAELQGVIDKTTDQELRRQLVASAWRSRPVVWANELKKSEQFISLRDDYESDYGHVHQESKPEDARLAGVPDSTLDPPSKRDHTDSTTIDGAWTPKRLEEAARKAGQLQSLNLEEFDEPESPYDELARQTFGKLTPQDRLFQTTEALKSLKEHYPVVGEFLSVIAESVTDVGFETIRRRISEKLVERERLSRDTDLAEELRAALASSVGAVHLQWQSPDLSFADVDHKLSAYIETLKGKEALLAAIANREDRANFAKRRVEAEKTVQELFSIARATGSPSIQREVVSVNAWVAELSTLENSWQALPSAKNDQAERIGHIIDSAKLALGLQNDPMTQDFLQLDDTPGAAMSKLSAYCGDAIMRLVAASHGSRKEAAMKAALGSRFEEYLARGDDVVEMKQQKAEAEKAVQKPKYQQGVEPPRKKEMWEQQIKRQQRMEHPRI